MAKAMLPRILEPELMDTAEDAREYDAMDHAAVNSQFVTDLLNALTDRSLQTSASSVESRPVLRVLDLGAGTAQIPIELARRAPAVHTTAVDAAESMLAVARENIAKVGLKDRIELVLTDAKHLPFDDGSYSVVVSNSILHHIAEPREVIAEAIRVATPGGLLFHRDLARPRDEAHLSRLVDTYAGDATSYQRKLFADSLRAALTLVEMRALVANFGLPSSTVQLSSDRHWTWDGQKRRGNSSGRRVN
ncbi:MAG: methyltransferase domain-containing protein [Pirellulales bacterium]